MSTLSPLENFLHRGSYEITTAIKSEPNAHNESDKKDKSACGIACIKTCLLPTEAVDFP